jgi:hypothetical protein
MTGVGQNSQQVYARIAGLALLTIIVSSVLEQ